MRSQFLHQTNFLLSLSCRSAFFHGQIEQAARGMGSWLPRPDIPVLVTINATGVSVIDPKKSVSRAVLCTVF